MRMLGLNTLNMMTNSLSNSKQVKEESLWLKLIGDKTLVLWSLPILGTLIAILFDIGYIAYFDIPPMYAEINFYTISCAAFTVLVFVFGIYCIVVITRGLKKSPYILLRFMADRFSVSVFILFLLFFILTHQSIKPAFWIYSIFLLMKLVFTIFGKKQDGSFRERLESQLYDLDDSTVTKIESHQPFRRLHNQIATLIIYGLPFLIFIGIGNFAARHLTIWVLADDPSTIVIKRNNDSYLLKRFDPNTLIMEETLKVIKNDGSHDLVIRPVNIVGGLRAAQDIEWEKQKQEYEKERYESQSIYISRFFEKVKKVFTW